MLQTLRHMDTHGYGLMYHSVILAFFYFMLHFAQSEVTEKHLFTCRGDWGRLQQDLFLQSNVQE